MIQPISGFGSGVAQAAGVKEAPTVQRPDSGSPARPQKPMMDEFVPEEKREPSGRYYLGKDENGQPKVFFDGPEQDEGPDAPKPKAADGKKAETCTGNTDQVDREIERLKKEKEQLERQINSETDETKKKELESRLSQVDNELRQKDNDAYRRQHTVFS